MARIPDHGDRILPDGIIFSAEAVEGQQLQAARRLVVDIIMAVQYNGQTVSELIKFKGDRNTVIESATNHAMFMLIKLLRNSYTPHEEINDD